MSDIYRQYVHLGNSVFEYKFESLNSFLNYIENATINLQVFSDGLSSEKGDYDFTKTNSLEEAKILCQNGCDEDFVSFLKLKNEVSKTLIKPLEKTVTYKDVVGYAPCVADFVIGSPLNMWNKSRKTFNNLIDIYFQLNYNCGTSTSQIYNRGAITLSLIDALEKSGYAVNLHVFNLTSRSNNCCYYDYHYDYEYFIALFKLKDYSQYLNEKVSFFPLCHPSFLRRCIFRLMEATPFKYSWQPGYGRPSKDIEEIKDYIKPNKNSIIISTPQVLGIKGNNIYSDMEALLKSIEFEKYIIRA